MSRSERRTRSTYCSVVAEILEWTLRSISSAAIDVEAKVAERFAGGGASFRLPEYPDVTCTVTGFGGGGTEQMTVPLLKADATVTVGDTATAFPCPLSKLPAGSYRAQAVLDMHHDNSDWHREPGNLFSHTVSFTLEPSAPSPGPVQLRLDQKIAEPKIPTVKGVELFEMRSELLSKFHGREIKLRAGVVLPLDRDAERPLPAVYEAPGFGGDAGEAFQIGRARLANRITSDPSRVKLSEESVYIVLDPESGNGHTLFADSANNGPCARALVEELIPALEKKYNLIPKPEARIITGHSSGGWSSLWLALTHPETFGACWSSSPDPVDFRRFQKTDIYSESNIYRRPVDGKDDGKLVDVPSFRDREGITRMTVLVENEVEEVLGPGNTSGQQWDSWMAVFGPRGKDGNPAALYDPTTGAIDHAIAEQFKAYDIGELVRKDPAKYLPILRDHVRLVCGTEDSFFLNEAVALLKADVQKLTAPDAPKAGGYIELLPGDHGSVMFTPRARAKWREMLEYFKSTGMLPQG